MTKFFQDFIQQFLNIKSVVSYLSYSPNSSKYANFIV